MQEIVKHEKLLSDFEALKSNPEKKNKKKKILWWLICLSMAQQKYE